jgi:hypothetical protein
VCIFIKVCGNTGDFVRNNKLSILLIVLCMFAGIPGCCMKEEISGPKREAVAYDQKVFKGLTEPEIIIEMDSGSIDIYSWNQSSVKIEITKRVRGMKEHDTLIKELDKFIIVYENENDRVHFSSRYEGNMRNPVDVFADVCVYIPQILSTLECRLDVGKIDIYDDIRCTLIMDVNTVNSDIRRFEGLLNFNAGMGDLTIGGGRLKKGSIISTGMGNITIKAGIETEGEYHLKTGLGNIELSFPESSSPVLQCEGNLQKNEFEDVINGSVFKIESAMGKITVQKHE